MHKSLDEIKQQLSEFAGMLDQFKSESVQVKVIEKLLDNYFENNRSYSAPVYNQLSERTGRRGRPRKEGLSADQIEENNRSLGATKVLTQLFQNGFFKKKRQIGDIIRHSWETLNSDVKATEVSGLLLRFVKEGKLDRDKNAVNNRFEYFEASGVNVGDAYKPEMAAQ